MLFVQTEKLKTGMRLAKPIYNKNGVMLYERDSKLTSQGIVSIHNFGLIGVYILEPAEPVPPMTEDDIEFERFQAMAIFTIKEVLDQIVDQKEPKGMYPFANQIIKNYGSLNHKINFVQNIRSAEDYCYKHALNTAILCALMSKKMNFEFKKQLDVVVAGIIHDLGNLLVPVDLRKKSPLDVTDEDIKKLNTYHFAGYQLINRNYDLDPNVRRVAGLGCRDIYHLTQEEEELDKKIPEVEVLKVASFFDDATAMKFGDEPLSEINALRQLLDPDNEFDQKVVQALIDSINILQPGVCVELTNGDRGLVIAEGQINVLQPFVLSFRDNQVLNLGEGYVAEEVQIKDIMKTMDNRHVVDNELLASYQGAELHIGQKRQNKYGG